MKKRYQCEVEIVNDCTIYIHCPREKYGKITKHISTGHMCLEEIFDEKGVPHLTFYPPIDTHTQEKELEDCEISYFMDGNDEGLYSLPFIGICCWIIAKDQEETKQYHRIVLNILNDDRVVKKGDRLQNVYSGHEVVIKEIMASGYRTADDEWYSPEYFIDKDDLVYWDTVK